MTGWQGYTSAIIGTEVDQRCIKAMLLLHELGKFWECEWAACSVPQKGLDDYVLEVVPSFLIRNIMERSLTGRAKGFRGVHYYATEN